MLNAVSIIHNSYYSSKGINSRAIQNSARILLEGDLAKRVTFESSQTNIRNSVLPTPKNDLNECEIFANRSVTLKKLQTKFKKIRKIPKNSIYLLTR